MLKAREIGIGEDHHHQKGGGSFVNPSRPIAAVDDFEAEVGKGVKCTVNGRKIHIGNRRSLEANGIIISPGTFDGK